MNWPESFALVACMFIVVGSVVLWAWIIANMKDDIEDDNER